MLCCLSRRPVVTLSVMASAVIAGAAIASLRTDAHASVAQAPSTQGAEFLGLLTRMGFDRLFAIESRATA